MKYFFILICFALSNCAFSQNNARDSLDYYINKLNWSSFEVVTNYISKVVLKEDAKEILAIKSKNKIKRLVSNISNSEKTVVIHMILTRLLEPRKDKFNYKYRYAQDSSVRTVQYTYNGLTWSWSKEHGNIIEKESIDKVKNYWSKRLENSN